MLKIGITGNIASGKSTIEKIIENLGYKVIDLDVISHNLFETKCKQDILNEFGTLDRKKIASIVFDDKKKLKKLENIIHPKLKEYVLDTFEKFKNENCVFVSGALIFEAGFNKLFDKIIFVDSKIELRLKRLIKRDNYTIEEAEKRINSQNDSNKKYADFIIDNNKDELALEKKVISVIDTILKT